MNNDIQKKLATHYKSQLQNSKESSIIAGILAHLAPSFFIFIGWLNGFAPIWWAVVPLILGTLWSLNIAFWHKRLARSYHRLPTEEREPQILYDSIWTRTWQAGTGLLLSTELMWSILIIAQITDKQILAYILFAAWLLVSLICLVNYRVVAKVSAHGTKKYPWARVLMFCFFGLMGLFSMLPGIGSMLRLHPDQERIKELVVISITFGLTIISISIFIGSLVSLLIAQAQYKHLLLGGNRLNQMR